MTNQERMFKAELSNDEFIIFYSNEADVYLWSIAEEEARNCFSNDDITIFEIDEIDENYNTIRSI